ncbi:hypothetical protein HMPREF9318_01336 [Streptococcus urinalis FB127-CNA-2]|uniref:Sensor histidine kinase n=1 Tax=Streptococcus urinalis 2285-97 TaxID=764291 RepID=G5KCR5_9STRE|nr:sensor histidine kinase [Streptococcus urinalis]EHJ57360.1 histidine kinase [Streptococcus urinalis 2285-97]EKS19814.1 hypothetical protein HMPREF9318_01336 [Streptococcus urinalis FB127-CNA-2]VEF31390.1 sensor histidine kinase [Streptococcus urinalis]
MKKRYYFLIWLYSAVTILSITYIIMDNFNIHIRTVFSNWQLFIQFFFSIIFLILSVTVLLLLLWVVLDDNSKRMINQNLRRIVNNQAIVEDYSNEINTNLARLSKKMSHLTQKLQRTENTYIQNNQEIVKQERKRIARDLHDTVSQELFASSMILSGLSMSLENLDQKELQNQILTVEKMLQNTQNDLRILLLHLRPTELDQRSLSEGLELILKELTDKSNICVTYQNNSQRIPKPIEDNLFRIAQEFISNTLKHADASQLEVYIQQTKNELQLKMIDNGKGFDMDKVQDLSYGLKNIEDRVDDMAGTVDFLSQIGKGVVMTVRLPLIKGENDDNNKSSID